MCFLAPNLFKSESKRSLSAFFWPGNKILLSPHVYMLAQQYRAFREGKSGFGVRSLTSAFAEEGRSIQV